MNVLKTMLAFLCMMSMTFVASAQQKKVMVMEIKNEIDPRMTRYVELALGHAKETKADIVIIEMDTYGGVLTDAKEIVDKIMAVQNPVWVFINSDAASAGALISIACDSIYMSPGASIGAATVVDASGGKAPDKYQSYMRSIMRSTAEERGRNPTIAEGMVDEQVELEGVKKVGQVITFSTSEAIEHGYCEGKVESIEEILRRNNVADYKIDRFNLSTSERVIAFFLNPFISGILILAIIGGIYFEMQTPGVGFPGAAALIALILYLVPYYLNGLAQNWEILTLFIGFVLIVLEVFVIPGFGVAGFAGITITIGSLVLIMINNNAFDFEFVPMNDILIALASTMGGILGGIVLLFVGSARLANTKLYRRIALTDTQERTEGYTSNVNKEAMNGKKGLAQTVLRPSGKVTIEGHQYDAFTRGEFIDKGKPIEVINEAGSSLQVKQADN
ncbi:MAG: ATP-dependent Clp protease proteolytic subunit [Cyclobacteriaceae bacterium]|nr:ATP-dependent Clp protease proteolytic subunit [Cyclobacteriaceae bacterium]MDH4297409.1 ATP-dependent Clp protease proteolytic subunit [Cyclobacteriaceae bacterium]MDH5251166.1 ATP-dependent Clp protease proteolytic subunit [Cyclobacteriaceae bacterium]